MKSIKFRYIIIAVVLLIAGCRKDDSTTTTSTEPNGDPTIEVVSGVTGMVKDETGKAISSATVGIYNRTAKTDENGIFYVNNVGLKASGSVITVEKDGYFAGYKNITPSLGKKSYVQLQLVDRGSPQQINTASGGEVSINGGAKLTLPANSIVEKDGGATYSGAFNVYTHWYDPTDPDLGLTMPGNLLGIQSDGTEAQLGTYGMIAVEMETPQGKSLQLAPNTTAQLRFPVPNSLQPPNSIALWSFDEMDGVWVEEGTASLNNGFYEAKVSHFSFWNCDDPFPLVEITGKIVQNGSPLSNFRVSISVENLNTGFGYTNNEGVFTGKVPKDRELTMTLVHCGETIYSEIIGSFNQDTDLGEIEVDLLNFITVVRGRLLNCSNTPLADGYGLLRSGELVEQVITPKADGTFEAIVVGCMNDNYSVQFYDPITIKGTEITTIITGVEENDLGDIRVCDGLDEFVQIYVNGNLTPLILESDVFFANEEKLIIRASNQGNFNQFEMDIFANGLGEYNPSTVSVRGTSGIGNAELTSTCGDHNTNFFPCNQFKVTITEFSEFVSGTFIGTLIAKVDTFEQTGSDFVQYAVDGSFRVSIDDFLSIGEISGQFWLDENGNNTRENDEDLSLVTQSVRVRKTDGSQIALFPDFLSAYSQSYKFTNLLPGTYTVSVFTTSGYDLVAKGVGSGDRDCDFNDFEDIYVTDEIVVVGGETVENIDCGFSVPDEVVCGDVYATGCVPNLKINLYIGGGVPPYSVTLNGNVTEEFYESVIIDVDEGGVYFFEVVDAVGNTCNTEGSINSYSNRINGSVWRDEEGGTPSVFDFSTDTRLSDIPVLLYDTNDNQIGGTVSQNGFYSIEDIPPGDYYVLIDVPGALMIVDQASNENNGNDIDPSTNRSSVFSMGDCDDFERIDIGLKSI